MIYILTFNFFLSHSQQGTESIQLKLREIYLYCFNYKNNLLIWFFYDGNNTQEHKLHNLSLNPQILQAYNVTLAKLNTLFKTYKLQNGFVQIQLWFYRSLNLMLFFLAKFSFSFSSKLQSYFPSRIIVIDIPPSKNQRRVKWNNKTLHYLIFKYLY